MCVHLMIMSPPVGQAAKHHPASVDLELVKRLILTTSAPTLQKFLAKEFSCITKDLAGAHSDSCVLQVRANEDCPLHFPAWLCAEPNTK